MTARIASLFMAASLFTGWAIAGTGGVVQAQEQPAKRPAYSFDLQPAQAAGDRSAQAVQPGGGQIAQSATSQGRPVPRDGAYLGIRAIGAFATQENTTTTGFTGATLVENDFDQVAGPAFVGGWVFRNFPLRAEIEAGMRYRFDYDVRDLAPGGTIDYEMDVRTWQVLVNMVLEWRNTSAFTPFVGGTVGWARNHMDIQRTNLATQAQTTPSNDQDNIAWGGMLGIDWRFAPNWSTDLSYRYINLGPAKSGPMPGTGETIESDAYHSHDVLWSIYYHF